MQESNTKIIAQNNVIDEYYITSMNANDVTEQNNLY